MFSFSGSIQVTVPNPKKEKEVYIKIISEKLSKGKNYHESASLMN